MPTARIEIEISNPKDYIEILSDPSYRDKNIRISHSKGKLSIAVNARSARELLASTDGIIKKLLIVSSAEKAIADLKDK